MSPAMAAASGRWKTHRCAGDAVMDRFEKLSGIAAPLLINIDTDMIIPKVF